MASFFRKFNNYKLSLARLQTKMSGSTHTNTTTHQSRRIAAVEGDDTHLFWGCSNPVPPSSASFPSPCKAKVYGRDNATAACGATHPDCHTANDLLFRRCRECGARRARGDAAVTQKGDVVGLYASRDAVLYFEAHHCRADHFYWECSKDVGQGTRCKWRGPVYYQSCRRCGRFRGGGDLALDYEGEVIGRYEGIKKVAYERDPNPDVLARWIYRPSSGVESGDEVPEMGMIGD